MISLRIFKGLGCASLLLSVCLSSAGCSGHEGSPVSQAKVSSKPADAEDDQRTSPVFDLPKGTQLKRGGRFPVVQVGDGLLGFTYMANLNADSIQGVAAFIGGRYKNISPQKCCLFGWDGGVWKSFSSEGKTTNFILLWKKSEYVYVRMTWPGGYKDQKKIERNLGQILRSMKPQSGWTEKNVSSQLPASMSYAIPKFQLPKNAKKVNIKDATLIKLPNGSISIVYLKTDRELAGLPESSLGGFKYRPHGVAELEGWREERDSPERDFGSHHGFVRYCCRDDSFLVAIVSLPSKGAARSQVMSSLKTILSTVH